MKLALSLLLFFLLFSAVKPSMAEIVTVCKRATSPVKYGYCIHRESNSQNPDVVYNLHGLTQDEHAWISGNYGRAIEKTWGQDSFQAPIVVSISFGGYWLLAEKNTKPLSGLYPVFLQIMSDLEKTELLGVIGKRMLIGESMGGFNGLQLYLKRPELFDRAAIMCPTIAKVNPWSPQQDIGDYISRTHANHRWLNVAMQVTEHFFDSAESYAKSDPLVLALAGQNKSFPRIHLSCGDRDQFGIYEGAQIFRDKILNGGAEVVWQPLSGGHCVKDATTLARFLE